MVMAPIQHAQIRPFERKSRPILTSPCPTPTWLAPSSWTKNKQNKTKLREITARLKVNLTKIKKITQAEGRGREADSSAAAKNAPAGGGSKDAKGAGDGGGGAEEGGSWRDAGGILGEMKEGINVNLKDVKVPEFDVRHSATSLVVAREGFSDFVGLVCVLV